MTTFVVDTNVAIVANLALAVPESADDGPPDAECIRNCVRKLRALVNDGSVAVDSDMLIEKEYQRHLHGRGGPSGVGDMFFKHVFRCWVDEKVKRVKVKKSTDQHRGFCNLPPNHFDPSDRKFLAVAVEAKAVVLNAVDSDWHEHGVLMEELNVEVNQLCPQHARKSDRRV